MKLEYLLGLEIIFSMSNKAIQAYCAGCIKINMVIVSEAI